MIMKIKTHGSLFSGIGAPELASEWMGWKNLFHCEINDFCRSFLEKRFKGTSYADITKTDFNIWRNRVDILITPDSWQIVKSGTISQYTPFAAISIST